MKLLLTLITFILTTVCLAGPGGGHKHGHGHSKKAAPAISKEKTGELGRFHIERLIKAKKLGSTWKQSKFDKSEMKKNEWVVTFKNDKSTKGKMLYIFLKKTGEFVAANFTGK